MENMRRLTVTAALGLVVVLTGLVGCTPAPPGDDRAGPSVGSASPSVAPPPTVGAPVDGAPGEGVGEEVALVSVVDGDTVTTSAGTVRLIGIDTPEFGECGHEAASRTLRGLVAVGDAITLRHPPGENDADRYGRLLRYVETAASVDLGLAQLQAGNAVARYDSTDGYPAHPREAAYHAAQVATRASDGRVVTTSCS